MSNKIAKFPLTQARRGRALRVIAPANDNRPRVRSEVHRARPRLACHWSVDGTGRLGCRWELEAPDDPKPSQRSLEFAGIHKTVFQPSYQGSGARLAVCPGRAEPGAAVQPLISSAVLHAGH
jgi:hypothetical protein